jgi:hypothetical protein
MARSLVAMKRGGDVRRKAINGLPSIAMPDDTAMRVVIMSIILNMFANIRRFIIVEYI